MWSAEAVRLLDEIALRQIAWIVASCTRELPTTRASVSRVTGWGEAKNPATRPNHSRQRRSGGRSASSRSNSSGWRVRLPRVSVGKCGSIRATGTARVAAKPLHVLDQNHLGHCERPSIVVELYCLVAGLFRQHCLHRAFDLHPEIRHCWSAILMSAVEV